MDGRPPAPGAYARAGDRTRPTGRLQPEEEPPGSSSADRPCWSIPSPPEAGDRLCRARAGTLLTHASRAGRAGELRTMTAFDLDTFLSLGRVDGLALSPDGSRLVTSVATVSPDGKRFLTALWQLDPQGSMPPRRLTRSAKGESSPAFLPDGSL